MPGHRMAQALPPSSPHFLYELRTASESAARAAARWAGRGTDEAGPAAVAAMQNALAHLALDGTVVVSDAGHDGARVLCPGDRVGRPGAGPAVDVAADPVEGTTYLARGMTNAMSVIAVAPRDTMLVPGPALYMEKLAVPARARGRVDPAEPAAERLRALADALDKPVTDLNVYVLERPRHRKLVRAIHKTGARCSLFAAGDVAGTLMTALPDSGIDALMGTGGVSEGILAACAMRALDADFFARFDPQGAAESKSLAEAGLDPGHWYSLQELVSSSQVHFCATGITGGALFDGVQRMGAYERTQTLMLAAGNPGYEILTSFHRRES